MDDVSDNNAIAGEGGTDGSHIVGDTSSSAIDCIRSGAAGQLQIPVTREEIAILRAFLSDEIDAIIYAVEQLPRD
jgi:hypothetical protein